MGGHCCGKTRVARAAIGAETEVIAYLVPGAGQLEGSPKMHIPASYGRDIGGIAGSLGVLVKGRQMALGDARRGTH